MICSINLNVSLSSGGRENEKMLDIMWCHATVSTDVEACIFLDSALVGVHNIRILVERESNFSSWLVLSLNC